MGEQRPTGPWGSQESIGRVPPTPPDPTRESLATQGLGRPPRPAICGGLEPEAGSVCLLVWGFRAGVGPGELVQMVKSSQMGLPCRRAGVSVPERRTPRAWLPGCLCPPEDFSVSMAPGFWSEGRGCWSRLVGRWRLRKTRPAGGFRLEG